MTEESVNLLISKGAMIGGLIIFLFAVYKFLDNYWEKRNDRAIALAKEKSAGEAALKTIEADIKAIEQEVEDIKAFKGKSEHDYTLLNVLVLKLREDYRFIMDRMFPAKAEKQ